jgi:hypothetical protein
MISWSLCFRFIDNHASLTPFPRSYLNGLVWLHEHDWVPRTHIQVHPGPSALVPFILILSSTSFSLAVDRVWYRLMCIISHKINLSMHLLNVYSSLSGACRFSLWVWTELLHLYLPRRHGQGYHTRGGDCRCHSLEPWTISWRRDRPCLLSLSCECMSHTSITSFQLFLEKK